MRVMFQVDWVHARACTCVACIQAWMALCVDCVLRCTKFQRALGHSSWMSTSIASHHMPACTSGADGQNSTSSVLAWGES